MPKKNVLICTKWSAATSQLETAIQLWFNEGDPVSTHTLAAAAHDCFNALSTFAGKPSLHQKWIRSQPKRIQQWAREPQNFFKHGHRYPKRQLHYVPEYSEHLMYDAALGSEHVSGRMRPTVETFMLRFVISHPKHLKASTDLEKLVQAKGFELRELIPLGRREFFEKVLPRLPPW